MTEQEWLAADDFLTLHHMLWHVAPEQPRKYRLVGCHFCRSICGHATDVRFQAIVDLAEQFAENPEMQPQLEAAFARGVEQNVFGEKQGYGSEMNVVLEACAHYYDHEEYCSNQLDRAAADAHDMLVEVTCPEGTDSDDWDVCSTNARRQVDQVIVPLIRDIFGNPFRPVTVDPHWQTETVVALATAIYTDRAFDRMPILADALEDAGCDNRDVLAHCRGEGPHVRGCWVVDLVLGKE